MFSYNVSGIMLLRIKRFFVSLFTNKKPGRVKRGLKIKPNLTEEQAKAVLDYKLLPFMDVKKLFNCSIHDLDNQKLSEIQSYQERIPG